MILLIAAVVALVLVIAAVSFGEPALKKPKKPRAERFTQSIEHYRLTSAVTERSRREELGRISDEYASNGYRLVERSGRDNLDFLYRAAQRHGEAGARAFIAVGFCALAVVVLYVVALVIAWAL